MNTQITHQYHPRLKPFILQYVVKQGTMVKVQTGGPVNRQWALSPMTVEDTCYFERDDIADVFPKNPTPDGMVNRFVFDTPDRQQISVGANDVEYVIDADAYEKEFGHDLDEFFEKLKVSKELADQLLMIKMDNCTFIANELARKTFAFQELTKKTSKFKEIIGKFMQSTDL